MTNLKNTFYEDKEMQDIMKKYYQKKKKYYNFINFLEDYNICRDEIFSVH